MAMFVKPPKTQCIKCIFCAQTERETDVDLIKEIKQGYSTELWAPRQSRQETKSVGLKTSKQTNNKKNSTELLKPPQVMNSFLNQFSGAGIFQTSSCGSNKTGKLIRWDLTSRCASIKETSASLDDCIIFNIYAINVQFVSRKWREIITSNFKAIHYGQTMLMHTRSNAQCFD